LHEVRLPQTERALLVALEDASSEWEESLEELRLLASSAGAVPVGSFTQKRQRPDPVHFLGRGKASELRGEVMKAKAELVLVDGEISPGQQRELENHAGVRVLDRTGLILDIFSQRAHTAEGNLQVELAQLSYLLPRLTGHGVELSRLGGGRRLGIGARGPGETKLESDRRRLRRRIGLLKKEVEQIRKQRTRQRRARQRAGLPLVGLVGYTNSGKSTLLNALCQRTGSAAPARVEDRLFATLDPMTRRLELPGGRAVLVTDTVGFIRNLPHQLVAAFRATLEEAVLADVLIHVIDAGHPAMARQWEAAQRVLGELGCATKPTLLAFNKTDLLPDLQSLRRRVGPEEAAVLISALTGSGLEELIHRLGGMLQRELIEVRVLLPHSASDLLSLAHERGEVLQEEHTEAGVLFAGRVPERLARRMHRAAETPR
jgi:GTP-binding protein HflX